MREHLLLLLGLSAVSVGDHDVLFESSLLDHPPGLGTDGVTDDSAVDSVLGDEWLKILNVVDKVWLETSWEHELGLKIASITSSWVGWGTPLLPAEAGINTTGAAP